VTDAVVPLEYGGRRVGTLWVAHPRAGEAYTGAEIRLLSALAPQVAVIVRALAECDRVLAAATTERDRLRHDLHDGLGPSLSGIGLGLQALTDTLHAPDTTGNPAAAVLLDRIRAEVTTAVAEVRRIIDNLRPAALDQLSLIDAIRRHGAALSGSVTVEVTASDIKSP
jgi:signal transduction histidine kinase